MFFSFDFLEEHIKGFDGVFYYDSLAFGSEMRGQLDILDF